MDNSVEEFVIKLIQKKSKLPENCDMNSFNYIDSGYVDSVGLIKFLLEIESNFDIEISEADIESDRFKTIGGLVSIIKSKSAGS